MRSVIASGTRDSLTEVLRMASGVLQNSILPVSSACAARNQCSAGRNASASSPVNFSDAAPIACSKSDRPEEPTYSKCSATSLIETGCSESARKLARNMRVQVLPDFGQEASRTRCRRPPTR